MKYFIYNLDHTYTDEIHTDSKNLGYFNDLKLLEEASKKALQLPGLRNYSEGLKAKKVELDKVHWGNGFQSITGEIGRDYLPEDDSVDVSTTLAVHLDCVFPVHHIYTIHTYLDDERTIGIFMSKEKAEEVVSQLKLKQGFKERPDDFVICKLELNHLHWSSGFSME